MLRKDLLRVSRAGGAYRPEFVGREARPLAAKALGTFQDHVGERRGDLDAALEELEAEADDFKLVRGFAALLEREAEFETDAPLPPDRARRVAFEAAEAVGVASESDRETALRRAGDRLGVDAEAVEAALYADRDVNQVMASFDSRWGPDDLIEQYNLSLAQEEKWDHSSSVEITPDALIQRYNLSLAQTALFDATEVRVRCSDPKSLVSAVKRLGLMYEIVKEDGDWEVVITGPDALFTSTRRYGTRFARLLRSVAKMESWQLTATIDDRGTERTMRLSDEDPVRPPGAELDPTMDFDSGVEADFAARFQSLDLDWELVREPEPLQAGNRVMIPDFAFDHVSADFRVFFEIMGFWTPEYVEKKLDQLGEVGDVEMLVAVDETLGVSEEIEARDHRAILYSGTVRVKDVRDALRFYEEQLTADIADDLPDEIRPDAEVVGLDDLADDLNVVEDAFEGKTFPEHERIGRTFVRPAVLDDITDRLEPGMSHSEVEELLAERGLTETSAVLSRLGYKVVWEGLGSGVIKKK